jgi:hypothetical protein
MIAEVVYKDYQIKWVFYCYDQFRNVLNMKLFRCMIICQISPPDSTFIEIPLNTITNRQCHQIEKKTREDYFK